MWHEEIKHQKCTSLPYLKLPLMDSVGSIHVIWINLGQFSNLTHKERVIASQVEISRAELFTRHVPHQFTILQRMVLFSDE